MLDFNKKRRTEMKLCSNKTCTHYREPTDKRRKRNREANKTNCVRFSVGEIVDCGEFEVENP